MQVRHDMERVRTKSANRIKGSLGDGIVLFIIYFLVGVITLIVLVPLIHVVACSFSSPNAIGSGKVWLWPINITLAGYRGVFSDKSIITGYANTFFYTVVGTMINLAVTVPCGYALSKKTLPGRNYFMIFFMITMYFGGGMIPTYLLIQSLGLYNTRLVLLILGAFSTYNCIICRTFFSAFPEELEDAARIDGCGVFRCFLQIVMPLSKALMGVMVLYFAIGHWNSYFSAMMYLNKDEYKPLQLILRRLLIEAQQNLQMMEGAAGAAGEAGEAAADAYNTAQLIKYAVIIVSSVPVMILYPFLQKYFDKGVMLGSLKG